MAKDASSQNAMRQIQADIAGGTFRPCYLLYGTESYLIRQYRQNLIRAVIPDGDTMNLYTASGSSFDLQSVIDLAETMPFFNEYRMIVLEDSGLFRGKNDRMAEYLTHIPPSTIFLFTEYPVMDPKYPDRKTSKSVDKRSKCYKTVVKYGFAAELVTPSEGDLMKWVLRRIREENKQISDRTLHLFLSRSTSDMNQIRSDLEKLLSYAMDQAVITDADVEAICSRQPEDQIFQMIDAVSAKNRTLAYTLYGDLIALRTPPGRILYLIANQYTHLVHVRELQEKGMSTAQIEEETGLRRFAVEKYIRLSSRYTLQELYACLSGCAEAEEAYKTGRLTDQMSVELLIAELSA